MLLEHRRTWKREIVLLVLTLLIGGLLVYGLLRIFVGNPWATAVCWIVLAANVIFFVWTLVELIRNRGDFACTINDQYIECCVPIPSMGHSFKVDLDDIVAIHLDSLDIGGTRIDLHTRDGRKFWLTSNFGNPAEQFLRLIQELRPQIPVRRK